MASLETLHFNVQTDIKVKAQSVAMWRLKVLGFVAKVLGIPLTVDADLTVTDR